MTTRAFALIAATLLASPAFAAESPERIEAARLHAETLIAGRACGYEIDMDALQAWGASLRPGEHDREYTKLMFRSMREQDERLAGMSNSEHAALCNLVGRRLETAGLL